METAQPLLGWIFLLFPESCFSLLSHITLVERLPLNLEVFHRTQGSLFSISEALPFLSPIGYFSPFPFSPELFCALLAKFSSVGFQWLIQHNY